jgi:CHAT domain-containing protein
VRLRAVVPLLVALVFTGARQQSTAPEQVYAEARLAFDRGDHPRAIELGKEGRRQFGNSEKWRELFTIVIAESLNKNKGRIAAGAELASVQPSGDTEAAIRLRMARGYISNDDEPYAKADALAAKLMPSLRPEIAVRRAAPAMAKDDYEAMERFARLALDGLNPVEQPILYVNARTMWACAAMKRLDYQEAIERFLTAKHMARAVGATGTASTVVGNLGFIYLKLGDAEEAIDSFEEALRVARQQGNSAVQVTWLANMAAVYTTQQQTDEALRYAEESVRVARTLRDNKRLALALNNLAQVKIDLERYGDARQSNDEALALYRELEATSEAQYAQLNAARIEGAIGSAEAALAKLTALASTKDLPLRWNAQAVMARIYKQHGRLPEAERMYEAALDTGDIARVETKSDIAYLFAFEANLFRFYDEAIDLLLERGRTIDALRVAERNRARTLRRRDVHESPEPTALARTHDATILSYWLGPHRSLLWVVTGDGASLIKLPPRADIKKAIDAYRDEMIHGNQTTDSERGASLYRMLVAPAIPAIRSDRVIVVADGPLATIPLDTLIAPNPKPHFWIKDVTLSYAPSLQYLGATQSRRSFSDGEALIMGDVPEQGSAFPQLPHAGDEIKLVAQHFDPRRRHVFTGDKATASEYLLADLSRVWCIHFVTHGTASEHSPLESSLILAKGGRLTGHDIIKVPLDAELVTVASCNSAGKRSYSGEGLVGLGWAFLDAGARRVVASQWEVNDGATAKLMNDMYGALAKGDDPAAALRKGKLALMNSKGIYSRPFYWAPFILYGAP